tara:strand:+ start:12348 stop:13406 length:1059 start_codon:yes stop_codon:yes gene_type:complete
MALFEYYLMWGAMGALVLYMSITLLFCSIKIQKLKTMTYATIAMVGVVSLGIYIQYGAHQGVRDRLGLEQIDRSIAYLHKKEHLTKDIVVAELAQLQDDVPKSERTWAKLGDMYQSLSLYEKAENAFKQASIYNKQEPYYQVQQAYCQVMLNSGKISLDIVQRLSQLENQHPKHKGILNLLALHAYQNENYELAAKNWSKILSISVDLTASERKTITAALQDARSHLSKSGSHNANLFSLKVRVDIAQPLKAKLSASDVVYIFAKHVQGPPMPVAVVRQPLQEFPIEITLSDEDSMVAGQVLSQAESILVGARISKSGQATPQAGDFEGFSAVVDMKQAPALVQVEISQERA